MTLHGKDYLTLGLGAAAIGAGAYDWSGNGSSANGGSKWGMDNYGTNANAVGNMFGGSNGTQDSFVTKQNYTPTTNNPSYLNQLGSGLGNFFGSDGGKAALQYGSQLGGAFMSSNAATKAAEMQSQSADKDRQAYLYSLAQDQARLDLDEANRTQAGNTMGEAFSLARG